MTRTVGAKGQVVIPKEIRERFGITPGDKVSFWVCDDHIGMRLVDDWKLLRGRFRGFALSESLQEDRLIERHMRIDFEDSPGFLDHAHFL